MQLAVVPVCAVPRATAPDAVSSDPTAPQAAAGMTTSGWPRETPRRGASGSGFIVGGGGLLRPSCLDGQAARRNRRSCPAAERAALAEF